jgi:C_GCAxxG_C_C family probable redox protein
VLAVGEYAFGAVDPKLCKIATGLGGGIGGTHQELCGALSGGVLILSALHGRTEADMEHDLCMHLSTEYRTRFAQELGSTHCGTLRESGFGSGGTVPCSVLVERAARVLLEILAEV